MRIGKLLYKGAHQAPLSMEFSRQEYWSELPFPSPGDLTNPGIKPKSPALQVDSLPAELPGKPLLGIFHPTKQGEDSPTSQRIKRLSARPLGLSEPYLRV